MISIWLALYLMAAWAISGYFVGHSIGYRKASRKAVARLDEWAEGHGIQLDPPTSGLRYSYNFVPPRTPENRAVAGEQTE